MFIKLKFSKNKIASIIFLLIALFISLFLGSYNSFTVHSKSGELPLSNILEPLDNISPASAPVPVQTSKLSPVTQKVDPIYGY